MIIFGAFSNELLHDITNKERIDNIKNAFKSDGPLSGSQAQELRNYENAVQSDEKLSLIHI